MLYRHYKGGLYRTLVDCAFHSESKEELVVYISVETGKVWVRPRDMFNGVVKLPNGTFIPRFQEVD